MVLIYCPTYSPRLTYAAKQLFGTLLGIKYDVTTSKDVFLNTNDAQINYSNEIIDGSITILPNGLLNITTLTETLPKVGLWENTPTLFANAGEEIPFDIFSAVFYLLSRHEEYTDTKRDQHGRFTAKQSFAYKNNFLHLPVINIWANKLRLLLNQRYNLNINKLEYKYISTIDIDHVFYYKYKPLLRNILGGAKQLLKGEFSNLTQRIQTTLGTRPDPNDVYTWLAQAHKSTNTEAIFFFLLGDEKPPYDPPPQYKIKEAKEIITQLTKSNLAGIHPSYHSLNSEGIVLEEKQRLEQISSQTVTRSRQHFLRFSLPKTYRVLTNCGIKNEYSMGYADHVGYRAGIASAFTWFDLEKNKETELIINPFAVMDVTLKNYMKLKPNDAIETINQLNLPVLENGGTFMSLWHNESVSGLGEWKNWRQVYQLLLTFSAKNGD